MKHLPSRKYAIPSFASKFLHKGILTRKCSLVKKAVLVIDSILAGPRSAYKFLRVDLEDIYERSPIYKETETISEQCRSPMQVTLP